MVSVLKAREIICLALLSTAAAAQEFPAFDCVITPYNVIDLSSAVPGLVEKVLVDKSDRVQRGQIVAQLEAGVERASVVLAKARAEIESEAKVGKINLTFDRRQQRRVESLYKQKVASPQIKDEADRDAQLSVWRLQQAKELEHLRSLELHRTQELLKQKMVRAPIDGFVMKKFKSAGEYVKDEAILRIAQLDPLSVETIVPMALFGKINVGMSARVYPEINPDVGQHAEVVIVDRIGDTASGTFGVRLMLANADNQIPAGIKCALKFDAYTDNGSGKQAHSVEPQRVTAPGREGETSEFKQRLDDPYLHSADG